MGRGWQGVPGQGCGRTTEPRARGCRTQLLARAQGGRLTGDRTGQFCLERMEPSPFLLTRASPQPAVCEAVVSLGVPARGLEPLLQLLLPWGP